MLMNANDVPNLSPLTKRGKRRERKNRIEEKKNGEGESERWELLKEGLWIKYAASALWQQLKD